MDIIGVITSVEDDEYQGKAFKRVTLGTGEVLKVKYGREGALKAKWALLQEGVAMKFTMKDYTTPDGVKIPFVFDIDTVEGELPPPAPPTTPLKPAPQEVGMWWKEAGEMIRSGEIKKDTEVGGAIYRLYYATMRDVLGVKVVKKED